MRLRARARDVEGESEGLLLSFLGKTLGFVVRLSLLLTYMDWSVSTDMEPHEVLPDNFRRAAYFIENFAIPMARRCYVDASFSKTERAGLKLVALIREQGWDHFSARDICRLQRSGLETAGRLNPVLSVLEEGDVIQAVEVPPGPKGGRPARMFSVNPVVHRGAAKAGW